MNTNIILILGILWVCYGIAGLLGIQIISKEFKGYSWTIQYKRSCCIGWLMIGIPWIILYMVEKSINMLGFTFVMLVVLSALPSVIYTSFQELKYSKKILPNTPTSTESQE